MAAGGVLSLVFGVGTVMAREAASRASLSPAPLPKVEPVASPSLPGPVLSAPRPEPEPIQAPAPPLAAAVRRGETAPSSSAKKKAPRSPPPAATPIASVQPSSAPPEPAPSEPAPQPELTGTLHLVMRGTWADVWVDGKKLGRAPPDHSYTLSSGEHEVELRNPSFADYRRTLVIPAGGTLRHTAALATVAQPPTP